MKRVIVLVLVVICLQSCFQRERNCESFKTGKFSFSYILNGKQYQDTFIRKDSIEITFSQDITDTSSVRWINDCEFIVRKLNPVSIAEQKAIHIKILSTQKKSYTFEYNVVGDQKNKQKGTAIKIE